MGFTDEMAAAFPACNSMPELLRKTLCFLEGQGCVRTNRQGVRYMTVHPEPENSDLMNTAFYVPRLAATVDWTKRNDPAVNDRLSLFLRTGGDGSWAGLWLDDEGQQRIVHLGSGSGSVMLCVLTENVEDLLRLLAIGYSELCWPEHFDRTPGEVCEEEFDDEDYPPPPRLFRNYVKRELGLRIPKRASKIVSSIASMDAKASDDPFWNWLKLYDGR